MLRCASANLCLMSHEGEEEQEVSSIEPADHLDLPYDELLEAFHEFDA